MTYGHSFLKTLYLTYMPMKYINWVPLIRNILNHYLLWHSNNIWKAEISHKLWKFSVTSFMTMSHTGQKPFIFQML